MTRIDSKETMLFFSLFFFNFYSKKQILHVLLISHYKVKYGVLKIRNKWYMYTGQKREVSDLVSKQWNEKSNICTRYESEKYRISLIALIGLPAMYTCTCPLGIQSSIIISDLPNYIFYIYFNNILIASVQNYSIDVMLYKKQPLLLRIGHWQISKCHSSY